MKKYSIFSIFALCLVLLIGGFAYGYLVGGRDSVEKPYVDNEKLGSNDTLNNEDTEISLNEEDYITPNTDFEFSTYYSECGDVITALEEPKKELIGMKELEFRNYISNHEKEWQLQQFSSKKVIIKIEKEQLCPEHYIIGVLGDNIAIYKINENGERILDTVLKDTSISTLKEIDQEKLKKGIVVNSKEEISNIVENFIS